MIDEVNVHAEEVFLISVHPTKRNSCGSGFIVLSSPNEALRLLNRGDSNINGRWVYCYPTTSSVLRAYTPLLSSFPSPYYLAVRPDVVSHVIGGT